MARRLGSDSAAQPRGCLMKLAAQVVQEMKGKSRAACPLYQEIMEHVLSRYDPVFAKDSFSKKYAELAADPEWFANSLVANAALEGYGAEQIWKFSNTLDSDEYAQQVRQHALDESRHSTMFISALDLVFPGLRQASGKDVQVQIAALQPRYSQYKHPEIIKSALEDRLFEVDSIKELIQVHITEIRALVLQYMLRNVMLAHAPKENAQRLVRISDSLIADEGRHIYYSARIFENYAASNRDMFFHYFEFYMQRFNELTLEELSREELEL